MNHGSSALSTTRKSPARILFVHHRAELGGAPESLAYLIREIDRGHFEPHVYCPAGPAASLFERAGATVHTGPVACFTHIWASTYRGRRWLLLGRELVRLPRHLARLSAVMSDFDFSLVHLNDSPPVAAAVLARRARLPVVWHLRSALPYSEGRWRTRAVRTVIGWASTRTIAINEDVAASFQLGSMVVPNAVDLDRFHPGDAAAARTNLELSLDGPVISTFGFLYPAKGFRVLLETAAILRKRGVRATYLLVGGGVRDEAFFARRRGRLLRLLRLVHDHERDARRLASTLELGDVVRFISYVDDTAELYRASDIVVAPSQGPELGRSVIEAAASGVPVVTSGSANGGGVVIPGKTGLMAEVPSAEAVAAAVETLLRDASLRRRIGASARQHAETLFDSARNARIVERVYLDLLQRDASGVVYERTAAASAPRAN